MKRKSVFVPLALFCILLPLHADDLETKKQKAVDLIERGLEYIKEVGKQKAFEEFSDPKGEFVDGEFYIFVVAFDGMTLAHGGNQKLVGANNYNLVDPDGKAFIKNFIELAKTKGKGWSDYKWSNPVTKKVQDKTTYVARYDNEEYFLGCGFYK